MIGNLFSYIEAGLDESLADFVKGVFAAAVVAIGAYSAHHFVGFTFTPLNVGLGLALGAPGLVSFWSWATTTANKSGSKVAAEIEVAG